MSRQTAAVVDIAKAFVPEGTGERVETASSDAALFARFMAGENAALVELFDRHDRRLHVYCLKVLGNSEQARDVTQELWVRVLRMRERPRTVANPVGFFLKVARNLCLNQKAARRSYESLDDIPDGRHPFDTPERESELQDLVFMSLDELSFDDRELLILNVYCGYRLDEIAGMLGRSPEALWKRASRARKRLRELVMKKM